MNVDPIPKNLVPVHELLTETLDTANDSGECFGYGVALFARTGRFDAPVFGVVTRGGESTTLTYRMLQALVDQPVFISGRVASAVRDGMSFGPPRVPPPALLDQPILHLTFTMLVGASRDDLDRTHPLESTIFAGDLKAPIVLLLEKRPAGWPW
ncbi:MAG: hypothetical protein ACRENB_00195 [Gemmatimonadales bacterium]